MGKLLDDRAEHYADRSSAPLKAELAAAYKAGFEAAEGNGLGLSALASLRWRAHDEGREILAQVIHDLEYLLLNWHHLPTQRAPLPRYPEEPSS